MIDTMKKIQAKQNKVLLVSKSRVEICRKYKQSKIKYTGNEYNKIIYIVNYTPNNSTVLYIYTNN